MNKKTEKKYFFLAEEKKYSIVSTTPSGAAKKAYSKYIRPYLDEIQKSNTHSVRLMNENEKIFEYDVHEISKHDIVKRGNKEIPYSYNVNVKSKNIHRSHHKSKSKSKSNSKDKKIYFFKKKC